MILGSSELILVGQISGSKARGLDVISSSGVSANYLLVVLSFSTQHEVLNRYNSFITLLRDTSRQDERLAQRCTPSSLAASMVAWAVKVEWGAWHRAEDS